MSEVDRLPVRDVLAEPLDKPAEKVAGQAQITLHFSLALENGEEIDSNFDGAPVTFCPGDGNLLPGFEAVVCAMATGERKTVTLSPAQAFGEVNEDNIQTFPHYQFPADLALEEGLMVAFNDASGYEQAGVITHLDRQTVTVDFNHPLAGKAIVFTAEIIDRKTDHD